MKLPRANSLAGLCLIEAMLLLLLLMLAAGFVFYLGRLIVDWVRELEAERERQRRQLVPEEEEVSFYNRNNPAPIVRVEWINRIA